MKLLNPNLKGITMNKENGIASISEVLNRCEKVVEGLRTIGIEPDKQKTLQRKWPLNQTAKLVCRERTTIKKIESELEREKKLDPIEKNEKQRVSGYSLTQINQFRRHFKTTPHRSYQEDPVIIAIQSFKGGVGKSVTSVTAAQYLAMKGYRVLLVDMDSQASSTATFGIIPDKDISVKQTIVPYFDSEQPTLHYAIRKTYWELLDIVPANLQVYKLESGISGYVASINNLKEKLDVFFTLRHALDTVKDGYDVVIIDSPPALGMISINILCAADGIIVPCPPKIYDFFSTVQYFRMVKETLERIATEKEYSFIKLLPTQFQRRKGSVQNQMLEIMEQVFEDRLLPFQFRETSEIHNASMEFKTVFEDRNPQKRADWIMTNVGMMIEAEIISQWPSQQDRLHVLLGELEERYQQQLMMDGEEE